MTDLYLREYKAACALMDAPPDQVGAAMLELDRVIEEEATRRKCRLCGCTEESPCCAAGLDGAPVFCAWVESDLCSHCASTMFRDHDIKTDRGAAIATLAESHR